MAPAWLRMSVPTATPSIALSTAAAIVPKTSVKV